MFIGNDLVDLEARRARGRPRHVRFIDRVFTRREADLIRAAAEPEFLLWTFWAGKEAAFRIMRKRRPDTPFLHRSYDVFPPDQMAAGASAGSAGLDGLGRIRVLSDDGSEEAAFPARWSITGSFIHCLATENAADLSRVRVTVASHDELELAQHPYTPSERERASVFSLESFAVRRLTSGLARDAGLEGIEIVRERIGRILGPPRLFRPGETEPLPGWDVSMSHDGRFAAAALAGPPTEGDSPARLPGRPQPL